MLKQKYIFVAVAFSSLAFNAGCSESFSDQPEKLETVKVQTEKQTLGDATPTSFSQVFNPYHEITPSRNERLLMHIFNRTRIAPKQFKIKFMDAKGQERDAEPLDLASYSANLSIPLRWYFKYQKQFNDKCLCTNEDIKSQKVKDYDSFTRACCELEVTKDGILQCKWNKENQIKHISCLNKDDKISSRNLRFRESFFVQTQATITKEYDFKSGVNLKGKTFESDIKALENRPNFFNKKFIGQYYRELLLSSSKVISPISEKYPIFELSSANSEDASAQDCFIPRSYCTIGGGTCKTLTGETHCPSENVEFCRGICNGGTLDKAACEIPGHSKTICRQDLDDKNNPVFLTDEGIVVGTPNGNQYPEYLIDGVAFDNVNKIENIEPQTKPGVRFAVNYFDYEGDPKKVQVVIDGNSTDLNLWSPTLWSPPDYSKPDSYHGLTFEAALTNLPDGCHKYYFVAVDSHGASHTFPEYGSLGIPTKNSAVDFDAITDLYKPNAENCNSYYHDERAPYPSTLKAQEVTQCSQGETRPCFTGNALQKSHGICKPGSEECLNGRWSGVCKGEVRPELYEKCSTLEEMKSKEQKDENCNGIIDEGCPLPTEATAPGSDEDKSDSDNGKKKGCSSTDFDTTPLALLVAGGIIAIKRRRIGDPSK